MSPSSSDDVLPPVDINHSEPGPASILVVADDLNGDAQRAKAGDAAVRNALYVMLRPQMRRFVRRYVRWAEESGAWDIDDVWQESFLVFSEVLASWPGNGDFIAYFVSVFPRRLATHVRRMDDRQPPLNAAFASNAVQACSSTPPKNHDAALNTFLACLGESDRRIVLLHVGHDLPLPIAASRLGISLDEIRRRWRTIKYRARRQFSDLQGPTS